MHGMLRLATFFTLTRIERDALQIYVSWFVLTEIFANRLQTDGECSDFSIFQHSNLCKAFGAIRPMLCLTRGIPAQIDLQNYVVSSYACQICWRSGDYRSYDKFSVFFLAKEPWMQRVQIPNLVEAARTRNIAVV